MNTVHLRPITDHAPKPRRRINPRLLAQLGHAVQQGEPIAKVFVRLAIYDPSLRRDYIAALQP